MMFNEGIDISSSEVFSDENRTRLRDALGHSRVIHLAQTVLPDFGADGVVDVDFEKLADMGITNVIFDLDLTLRRAGEDKIPDDILAHINAAQESGFIESTWIATDSRSDASTFAEQLNVDGVFQPFKSHFVHTKTSPYFWKRITKVTGLDPATTINIGDRYLKDIKAPGSDSVGMRTCKVEPLGNDYWFDNLPLRKIRVEDFWAHQRARNLTSLALDILGIEKPAILAGESRLVGELSEA
jgi:predicted HAD superfamily phosphohydrolase YqeG